MKKKKVKKRMSNDPYKVKRYSKGRRPYRWESALIEKAGFVTRSYHSTRNLFGFENHEIEKPITSTDEWWVFMSYPDAEWILIGDDEYTPSILAIVEK